MFEWDVEKEKLNYEKHGIHFSEIYDFDFEITLSIEDTRHDYGERRFRSLGELNERLVSVTWTLRNRHIRIISLRRAREKERKLYVQQEDKD